jgi:hypothetical protein
MLCFINGFSGFDGSPYIAAFCFVVGPDLGMVWIDASGTVKCDVPRRFMWIMVWLWSPLLFRLRFGHLALVISHVDAAEASPDIYYRARDRDRVRTEWRAAEFPVPLGGQGPLAICWDMYMTVDVKFVVGSLDSEPWKVGNSNFPCCQ